MLLAEDNLINQTVAKKMLGQMGMQCTVASNGAEAVDALRAAGAAGQQFEVVLMDMAMPVMGGVDATKVGGWPVQNHIHPGSCIVERRVQWRCCSTV